MTIVWCFRYIFFEPLEDPQVNLVLAKTNNCFAYLNIVAIGSRLYYYYDYRIEIWHGYYMETITDIFFKKSDLKIKYL